MEEPVDRQSHYTRFAIKPIEFIEANNLGYLEGNVIKYVCRYPYKGSPLRDLQKARDYLDHLIRKVEKNDKEGREEVGVVYPEWVKEIGNPYIQGIRFTTGTSYFDGEKER